ncbi:adhesion G-protein coupled receptor G2 isoform X3 [Takifugu rubripes]|uniref:adhesion G-protein coupled receptor G2 isoform X3 n=1 Tax=Takifugu rubripes TaxID=31033 RepID=UPI001145E57D|nr:adhesion G-protein coupled receptor G2-like isoform X3 [Takifugu rubripes]
MKASVVRTDGRSHSSVREPWSHIKRLPWLHFQLLGLLLTVGQASSNHTSTTPSPLASTTHVQPQATYYFVDITVTAAVKKNESEIKAWLMEAFQNNLESCLREPPTAGSNSSTPATTTQNYSLTTAAMTTALQNNTNTTTSAVSQSSNTTTDAKTTVLQSSNRTTTATSTLQSNNLTTTALQINNRTATTDATTALQGNNVTTLATTALLSNNKTTITTTPLQSDRTTTSTTPLESNRTTTSTTPLQSNRTTTSTSSITTTDAKRTSFQSNSAATTVTTVAQSKITNADTETTSESNSVATTVTTVAQSKFTNADTETTSQSNSVATTVTTVAQSKITNVDTETTSQSNSVATTVTTVAQSKITNVDMETTSQSNSVTPSATTTWTGDKITEATPSTTPAITKARSAQEVLDETQTSNITNKTTGLIQGIDVNCEDTDTRNSSCSVVLQLRQSVAPCCLLRTLCAASDNSSEISAVGKKVDRTNPLQNECESDPQEENSCVYRGQDDATCKNVSAYVGLLSNSTQCEKRNNSCSCSAYCSGLDAYYSLQLSVNDSSKINVSYILSLIEEETTQPSDCSLGSTALCTEVNFLSHLKNATVICENAKPNCTVILRLSTTLPVCTVSEIMMHALRSAKEIGYTGQVSRAAICGNSTIGSNFLDSQVTLVNIGLKPGAFCSALNTSNTLNCQNGGILVVQLDEKCGYPVPSMTTPSQNLNVTQANTTISPANTTSFPQNTTVEPQNSTISTNASSTAANYASTTIIFTTMNSTEATTESADSQANMLLNLARNVSNLNSSQVDQLLSQLENLLDGPNISLALGNTSVQIVSSLMGASPELLSNFSKRIIRIVDTVGLKLIVEDQLETLLSSDLALSVTQTDGTNFQEAFFSISDPNNVQVRGDSRRRRSQRAGPSIPQGSISLPSSLTQNLSLEEQQLASRVQFNFYQTGAVFQDKNLGKRRLNSGILGASVANLSITGLQDSVVIRLRNTELIPADYVSTCVFWDFTLNDGSGGWNLSGCYVTNSTDNETVCSCNHLTSFAILLDLSREPLTSHLQATILSFITYIGCGISAIFLSATLLTYLAFGKLRKDIPSKILIQLCLALLLLNLVFLVDAWLALYPEAVGLCISTAWFLHYFLLVSFTWMGLEAVHMYLALVKVFNSYISSYMLKFSLAGWGIPMVVVIIVIAVDKDNYGLISYGRFADGTTDDFCWLRNDIAFYVAVVAYFCVIFLFNFIMFIVVLVQLRRMRKQNPHNSAHRTTLQDIRSVVGITLLLGLTWGFAFFAWGPVNLAFMYLFAIFNSLQGFFIFVFHCAVKDVVRRQWRTYLCCGKMRLAENSEWSRTATQKTGKKSSVTRLTSLQSSQSNNTSSSTSCLVSESSDQNNSVGSPVQDGIITSDEDHNMDVTLNEINSQHRNQ